MSAPTASSYAVVLSQQRDQAMHYRNEQDDKAAIVPCKTVSHNCTLVENGRVVVKPIQSSAEAVNALQ